jgi:hypothetical protein
LTIYEVEADAFCVTKQVLNKTKINMSKIQITPKQLSVGITVAILIWGVTSISTHTEPVAEVNDKPQLEILEAKASEIAEVIPDKEIDLQIAKEELEVTNRQIELEKKKQSLNVTQESVTKEVQPEPKIEIKAQEVKQTINIEKISNNCVFIYKLTTKVKYMLPTL